jgi:hypothetical protein
MPPKNTKGSSQGANTGLVVTDDETQAELAEHFLGTLLLDVRRIERMWSESEGRNRTISERLVRQLVGAFQNGIQRYASRTRLVATIGKDRFSEILQSYTRNNVLTLDEVKSRVQVRGGTEV